MDIHRLRKHLEQHNQSHLLQFWDTLNCDEQKELHDDIKRFDIPSVNRYFQATMNESVEGEKLDFRMEPIPEEQYSSAKRSSVDQLNRFEEIGLRNIRQEKVASLLLAGGQGTRLGVNYPKGMYDVGLVSGKTAFQIQAERLQKIHRLASDQNSSDSEGIPWYIMTSEGTKQASIQYFKKNNYFGLSEKNVTIFEQGMLPALTFDGEIILENKFRIAKAPDGNGGLYKSLQTQGILQDMKSRGIEFLHVYCVDNVLVKMVDPIFMGYCIEKNADAGAKVVEKTNPNEQVGVFCKVDGKYQVVEYSEITSHTAELKNPKDDGTLLFNAGNICNHFFTLDFLEKLMGLEDTLVHHIAKKKIPYVDNKTGNSITPQTPNGIKLEKFVFDVFRFSNQFAVWEVPREEEFSPLKNSDSAAKDTPTTCRNDLFNLHIKYLEKAGVQFEETTIEEEMDLNNNVSCQQIVEISPLVTFAGEGLEYLANNFNVLKSPVLIAKKGEALPKSKTYNNQSITVIKV